MEHLNDIENKSTELIEKQRIGISPLEKVGNPERGYFVVLGKYRITESFKTKEDLDKYMLDEPEDFITRLISTMLEINEIGKQAQQS